MKLYRILTGADDAAFCHRVTAALNDGWALHGAPTIAHDPEKAIMVCAQAVVKEQPGTYAPDRKLTEQ